MDIWMFAMRRENESKTDNKRGFYLNVWFLVQTHEKKKPTNISNFTNNLFILNESVRRRMWEEVEDDDEKKEIWSRIDQSMRFIRTGHVWSSIYTVSRRNGMDDMEISSGIVSSYLSCDFLF